MPHSDMLSTAEKFRYLRTILYFWKLIVTNMFLCYIGFFLSNIKEQALSQRQRISLVKSSVCTLIIKIQIKRYYTGNIETMGCHSKNIC